MKFTREELEEVEGWVKSPAFTKVFQHIEDWHTDRWKGSGTPEEREYAWHMIRCLDDVQEAITDIVNGQKVDEFNRERARVTNWAMPKPLVE